MVNVNLTKTVNTSADELWNLLRDFNGLPKFVEAVTASSIDGEGVGAIRTLTLPNGAQIKERLEEFDDPGKRLVYSIVSGPLPVDSYKVTVQVSDLGVNKSELIWSSTFEAKGATEDEARNAIEGIYQMGFQGIARIFG
jgi:hypothetical protein